MNRETVDTLTNPEVIAVDQDPLGKQGQRARKQGNVEVWTRRLAGDATAVAVLNLGNDDADVRLSWQELGIGEVKRARDLWKHTDLPAASTGYSSTIKAHAAMLIRIQK